MFLRRFLPQLRYFASIITLKLSHTLPITFNSFSSSRAFLLFVPAPSFVLCNSNEPDLSQITKQELVQLLHRGSHEFVVIIYDKFKRLHEKEFGEELKPIIDECREAGLKTVYLIDSKESQHLQQIVRLLKNLPPQDSSKGEGKVKSFQVYFKAKNFNEAFEMERNKDQSLSRQIKEIRHYQFTANLETLTHTLNAHMNNPWNISKTVVVRQCLGEGECVDSFRREVSALIEQGMLSGKKDEFQFQLVVDQPSAILGSSSEYVKSFMKEAEKMRGRGMSANRKEQTYVFRKDLLGSEVGVFSEWLQRQGLNYSNGDRFMMFLRPRLHLISKSNTMSDLLWFIRSSRLNQQACLSLNNTPKFYKFNSQQSLSLLKLAHSHFPSLNYLIVSSEKVGELIRHLHADHKYVLFHVDSSHIWKKQFMDMDHLQSLPQQELQTAFVKEFKDKFQGFIDNAQIKNLVEVQRELQIGLQKLVFLRNRQQKRINLRKYILRVCRQRCRRDLSSELLQSVNAKLQQPAPVYWIDSTSQNVGVPQGDYLLKDGALFPLQQQV